MAWIIVILAVVVAGIAWLAAQGRLGGMPPLVDDRPGPDLPDADLKGDDLRGVRFAVVARGYSMPQVDALLDRMADQLDGKPYQPIDELALWAGDGSPFAEVAGTPVEPVAEVVPQAIEPEKPENNMVG